MSHAALILGESGSGKSASLRNLDPARTLLIQAVRKSLPFKSTGWRPWSPQKGGNVVTTDDPVAIERFMRKSPHEIVVIDDWQYILANEFMRRSGEKGFDKFTDIGRHAWDLLMAANNLADDRRVYILAHTATDDLGNTRVKTIGKLLDEKITPEGLFTMVLRTRVIDGKHYFSTVNSGSDTVKSPMGLFADAMIDNDLAAVDAAVCDYYGIGAMPEKAAA
ncbi:ATP-binding protein [Aquabacterium olei]|uniref:ATP-binding protein n=1 Tax=Aquabacterium olei TaxID=1296669 RepID=A0A2U8FRZ2_9BURK|nr:ATP-binding protein [Aquabacterium olei]AWI53174.1 ATP-binding protein [Aquabacterium olei]